jgi:serine phosphatase RsbU (regulator of sigma subunit)
MFASLALLGLYFRYRQDEERRNSLEIDLAAARKVQESLLPVPERAGSSAFAVDAVYLPAREVGGDFWQTVAQDDGSLLLVAGDVSGKGLPASMLVAAVVGALGTLESRRPAEVLAHLNRALHGKTQGAFVTCCCALFEPSGDVTVANAGHTSPFLGGRELHTEANLPLGVMPDLEFTEAVLSDRTTPMTFLSDGVVEAASASGELFGFERARQMSEKPASHIAEAARLWGQTDDITVVTVRRAAA